MVRKPKGNNSVSSPSASRESKTPTRTPDGKKSEPVVVAPATLTDQNWARKIEVAIEARRAGQVARKGKAAAFSTGRFALSRDHTA